MTVATTDTAARPHDSAPAASGADARIDAVIARVNRLFGHTAPDPAESHRPSPFAFRDAMSEVEREVYAQG